MSARLWSLLVAIKIAARNIENFALAIRPTVCAQKIKNSTMMARNWPDRWTTFASNERLRRLASLRDVAKDYAGVFWLGNIERWSQESDLHVRANVPGHALLIKFG
jgi:hypothetical protein